jgi:hypothetical protein
MRGPRTVKLECWVLEALGIEIWEVFGDFVIGTFCPDDPPYPRPKDPLLLLQDRTF